SISDELHGNFEVDAGLGPFSIGIGLEVHRGTWSEGDDVYLHLPGIVREDLSLRSESGTLYVGINSREHPVPFERPAKASQVQAKLEDEILKLTFPP
ncbi:MAG: Hsp20/alpha crystallin family protein, partial [Candidatus Poseidoniaceae archaeon]